MARHRHRDDARGPRLYLCPDCHEYVRVQEPACPFCGSTARADVSEPEESVPLYGGAPIDLPPSVRPEDLSPDASDAPADVEWTVLNTPVPENAGGRSVGLLFALGAGSVFLLLWWAYAGP